MPIPYLSLAKVPNMVNRHCPQTAIDRRFFLKAAGASALTLPSIGCGRGPDTLTGSVVVIGAELAGLAAE